MPSYSYEDIETGRIVEIFESMSETATIGAVVTRGGRKLRKLVPSFGMRVMGLPEPVVSHTLPKWDKHSKEFDKHGHPVMRTEKDFHERNARARDDPGALQMEYER